MKALRLGRFGLALNSISSTFRNARCIRHSRVRLLGTALAAIALAVLGATEASAQMNSSQPVYTKSLRFRIPYRYDAQEMQRLGAREIRLFVSYDRGVRWQFVRSVSPETGKFDFDAPGDGEYWFAVRTLDGSNQLHPPGNVIEPGLKVWVDTTPPSLNLDVRPADAGNVNLSWEARDPNLDARSLKLEYMQPGSPNWQPVTVAPQGRGQTSWRVPQTGSVTVRGSISDLAGNIVEMQGQTRIDVPAQPASTPSVPDFSQPVASNEIPTTADSSGQLPFMNPGQSGARSGLVSDRADQRPSVLQDRYNAPTDSGSSSTSNGRMRMVNTRKFQIGYQMEDVGPSGVSAVEFYITQDDGAKWWRYGNDPDGQTPFVVEVPSDGQYGFALRVRSGAGLSADPPQPGEKPSIVVAVDSTPPSAELQGAEQGQGTLLNTITIRWSASDDHLADRPIALSYAADPEGPWEPISGWQPNTGSYAWTIAHGMPNAVYIRLTARDGAGNVTRVETSQPVVIDLAKPSARIVDIEAVPSSHR